MRRSRKRLPWRRRPVKIPAPLPRRLHRDESGSCRAPKLGVYFDRSTECMNVTGVEWRDLDPHAGKFSSKRSEEHTSELQSLRHLVCRLLLEKSTAGGDLPRTFHVGVFCVPFLCG